MIEEMEKLQAKIEDFISSLNNALKNTSVKELNEEFSDEFENANNLLNLIFVLSVKTGLTQSEINDLSVERFVDLIIYHKIKKSEESNDV